MRFRRGTEKGEDVSITATEALAHSEAAALHAKARWPEVRRISGSLRRERLENNWAARVAELFKETDE